MKVPAFAIAKRYDVRGVFGLIRKKLKNPFINRGSHAQASL